MEGLRFQGKWCERHIWGVKYKESLTKARLLRVNQVIRTARVRMNGIHRNLPGRTNHSRRTRALISKGAWAQKEGIA